MKILGWVLLCLLCVVPAFADETPSDFHLIYEYDSGQRVSNPFRFRVTLTPKAATFTRWDHGEQTRETSFHVEPAEVGGIYELSESTHYFDLAGGVRAATLDSPSEWIDLNAGHRSLTVWGQTTGRDTPVALEALSDRVRALLQEHVYDWQTVPGSTPPPLVSPLVPLTVDAHRGEVGLVHLGDPAEAVQAVWGPGGGGEVAHRSKSTSMDYYDPPESGNSLLTVEYVDGRAGELRLNLVSPAGRELRGQVSIRSGSHRLMCDANTAPQNVLEAVGTPTTDSVARTTGTLQYGRLELYFYQGSLRWVQLAGTMENVAGGLPGDMPSDFEVTYWHRYSHQEQLHGSPFGQQLHITASGGSRTTVDADHHIEQSFFEVDPAELRGLYSLLQHANFFHMARSYPEPLPDASLSVMEGDEGVLVWSRYGVYRVDVLGYDGHEKCPPALLQIISVATRLGKGHVLHRQ